VSQVLVTGIIAATDVMIIKGTTNDSGNEYITSASLSYAAPYNLVWTSYGPENTANWSDALPINISSQYNITTIEYTSPYTAAPNSGLYYKITMFIYINWTTGEIRGTWNQTLGNGFIAQGGGTFSGTTNSIITAVVRPAFGSAALTPSIETDGSRNILRLPSSPNGYNFNEYTITNFS